MSNNYYFNLQNDNEYEYDEEEEREFENSKSDELSQLSNKEQSDDDKLENKQNNNNISFQSSQSNKNDSNDISSEYSNSRKSFDSINKNEIIDNNVEDKEYNNLLKYIINNNKIINTIIITENIIFKNIITNNAITHSLSKNKKICYLLTEIKKAQKVVDDISNNKDIKPLVLQKIKYNKTKNDYSNFRKQINENNIFLSNPNILYKLLSIGFIKISDFGLIIFDECHLCDGNHQYNLIMQEFYFYYINNKINMELPNIIGFTCSPFKDKNIAKNENKCKEFLKNISENLDSQVIVDTSMFLESKKNQGHDMEYINVDNYLSQKNRIEGINLILMKFFFEEMLNLCLKDYIMTNKENSELVREKKIEIKKRYLNKLKEKFMAANFERYNNIETSERSLHFLSSNSFLFKIFEDMQKHLINIIQNIDLEEIYYFFEQYQKLYEDNLKMQKDGDNKYLQKIYKKMIIIFKTCAYAFKRLLNNKVQYETNRLNKFMSKLNKIYNSKKDAKILVFVSNRKIANILYNYLNRDKGDNIFRNKSRFIVGSSVKREENILFTLATRTTALEIKERIKEYKENKKNILICTPSVINYLDGIACDAILLFNELLNSNNQYDKMKSKLKFFNSKLIVFREEHQYNKIDNSYKNEKDKECIQLKKLFMEKDIFINPKNFKERNFIKNNYNKSINYYISETEAKMTLRNCMMLFNEINNSFLSKGIKININKKTTNFDKKEQKYICKADFNFNDENVQFISNIYNDKQNAENECYMKYVIYLHQKRFINNHFQLFI